MQVLYPKHMHLNRGNHETTNMNKMYGFEVSDPSSLSSVYTVLQSWRRIAIPCVLVCAGRIWVCAVSDRLREETEYQLISFGFFWLELQGEIKAKYK